MRASKRNISKTFIEKEIYKTFEQVKECKTVGIAEFLKSFDASLFYQDNYRKIKFSYESLIKLVLFQKLKGIKFHTKLTKYLRRNPAVKFKLGFEKTPDRTQSGYFVNHILDEQTKELLGYTADKIIEVSEKFGILFDVKTLEPEKPKKETKERNQRLQKHIETKNVCKLFMRRVSPFINFHQHHNIIYKKEELINLLIHLGLSQDFAENGSKILREQKNRGPCGKTLLYHLKKYENISELQDMFVRVFEVVWNMARQKNIIDIRKRVDVAIDYTEWFYYGKKGLMVTSKKPERGTHRCYKFATVNIVDRGKRFTLLAVPVNVLENKEKILTTLLRYAQQRVKINKVYLDRGFFDSVSINTINMLHLKFLMPGVRSFAVKRVMQMAPAPSIVTGFRLRNTPLNLVIIDDKDRTTGETIKRVFATNIDFNENDPRLADRLLYLYSKRWGIETSYRIKKHSFRGKTTSNNYMVRLFYFMFSVLMYNLWILADVLIWLHLFGFVGEKHLVTSKYFGTLIVAIDPGG